MVMAFLPACLVPVIATALRRGEVGREMLSLPCFLVMRVVSSLFMLRAVVLWPLPDNAPVVVARGAKEDAAHLWL